MGPRECHGEAVGSALWPRIWLWRPGGGHWAEPGVSLLSFPSEGPAVPYHSVIDSWLPAAAATLIAQTLPPPSLSALCGLSALQNSRMEGTVTGTRHLRMGDGGSEQPQAEREERGNQPRAPPSAGSEVRASPQPGSLFPNGFYESFLKASAAGQVGLAWKVGASPPVLL